VTVRDLSTISLLLRKEEKAQVYPLKRVTFLLFFKVKDLTKDRDDRSTE
jgi:hypothetical protein